MGIVLVIILVVMVYGMKCKAFRSRSLIANHQLYFVKNLQF